jgi:hypothetical protein
MNPPFYSIIKQQLNGVFHIIFNLVSSILSIFGENIAFISAIWWGLTIAVDNIIDTNFYLC